ncbi:MAG TPA: hypothetical protein VF796_25305 [Humisphaera sp.]
MSSDTKSSGSGSGPTSSSEAAKRAQNDYDKALDPAVADADLTEDEYLRRQGERAKLAIAHTAARMKASLFAGFKSGGQAVGSNAGGTKDKVLKQHPWAVVGAAAGAGFLGAVMFSPNKVRKVRARLEALEKRFRRHEKDVEVIWKAPPEPTVKKETTKTAAKASLFSTLGTLALREGLRQAQPFVMKHLTELLHKAKEQRGASPDESGAGTAAAADADTHAERLDPRMSPGGAGPATVNPAAAASM